MYNLGNTVLYSLSQNKLEYLQRNRFVLTVLYKILHNLFFVSITKGTKILNHVFYLFKY